MSDDITEIDEMAASADEQREERMLPATVPSGPVHVVQPSKVSTTTATPEQRRVLEVSEALLPAYQRAGTLDMTEAEAQALMAPFADECVEIRPHDGLIYLPHILISKRLTQVFGPGKWALIRRREWMAASTMYGEYVLVIRGCYVGESIGGHPYIASNPKQNYSDALEATAAEALRRIAGKRLDCGSQVWEPEYARQWVAKYAENVRGRWQRKQAQPKQHAPAAPTPTADPPEPKQPEDSETKRQRWIALCRQAGGGVDWPAETVLGGSGKMPEFTKLGEMPQSAVPATKKEADALLAAIRAEAAKSGAAPDQPPQDEIPGLGQPAKEQPEQPGGETITGYIAVVTEKPTSKGGTKGGICLTTEPDQKEGGTWVNTFDTDDIESAKAAKGKLVACRATKDKFGYKLVKHGLSLQ